KLDERLAHIEGDKAYFVLFTNAKLTLEGALSDIDFTHNLSYSNVAMGYDEGTGTLFVSAPVSIPEPATATLSLLALAALAARRRRK
ncbi:MAG: PEP-CTERM sorting domain-containing protein, partial [Akkermansia sp.]|nr:PEP-CTERM sorting domain-containing protein [Akkermansia sp.]